MIKKKSIYPYLLVAPAVIIILCVVFIPVVNAISMSFQSYNLTRPKKIAFIGFDNYVKLFNDKLFWGSLSRTLVWVFFGVGCQFLFGFMLAMSRKNQMQSSTNLQAFLPVSALSFTTAFGIIGGRSACSSVCTSNFCICSAITVKPQSLSHFSRVSR